MTKRALAFLKVVLFRELNFEHFCLPALFNLISLTDVLSLVIILPQIPFLCYTKISKKQKHFLWEPFHTHFKKKPFLFALRGM